jgi:rubredoxin
MAVYVCGVCGYEYDEEQEGIAFSDLPEDWVCPVCGVDKTNFTKMD